MARKTSSAVIPSESGDISVRLTQVRNEAAMKTQIRLQQALAPALQVLFQQLPSEDLADPKNQEVIGTLLQRGLVGLAEDDVSYFLDKLVFEAETFVILKENGKSVSLPLTRDIFEQEFDLLAAWELLYRAIEVNYAGFIKGLLKKVGGLIKKAAL